MMLWDASRCSRKVCGRYIGPWSGLCIVSVNEAPATHQDQAPRSLAEAGLLRPAPLQMPCEVFPDFTLSFPTLMSHSCFLPGHGQMPSGGLDKMAPEGLGMVHGNNLTRLH